MLADWILAGAAVGAVAFRPRSWAAAGAAAALAGLDLCIGGAALAPALRAAWPMVALLTATIAASAVLVRLGASERGRSARGFGRRPPPRRRLRAPPQDCLRSHGSGSRWLRCPWSCRA